VPGQVQWDEARTSFANGDYGWATLHTGGMVGEQALFVLTLGGSQAELTAARTADGLIERGAAAREAVDAAQAAGRTNGAAAELRVGDKVCTDVSTGGAPRAINPKVQDALNKIPAAERSPFHGACAEVGCLSKAADAGVNPAGGTSQAVKIRAAGKEAHGSFMDACSSCKALLDYFGVKH